MALSPQPPESAATSCPKVNTNTAMVELLLSENLIALAEKESDHSQRRISLENGMVVDG